jgi:MinD superfamily P-loop ATPase
VIVPILPEIDHQLCTGCGDCIPACQPHALALAGGKATIARPDLCEYEGGCEPVCPAGAIQLPFLVVFSESTQVIHREPIC